MARAAWKMGGTGWQGRRPPVGPGDAGGAPARRTVLREESLVTARGENDASRDSLDDQIIDAPGEQRLHAALATALDAIAPPAFVVTRSGRILWANARAHALLAREGPALRRSLATALARASNAAEAMWDLAPLRGKGAPIGFLAIRRPPSREIAIADALRIANRRWKLTSRQLQVLELVARGLTNDAIAETLRIGKGTVEFHLSAVFDKAGVCNRATLIVRMYELE